MKTRKYISHRKPEQGEGKSWNGGIGISLYYPEAPKRKVRIVKVKWTDDEYQQMLGRMSYRMFTKQSYLGPMGASYSFCVYLERLRDYQEAWDRYLEKKKEISEKALRHALFLRKIEQEYIRSKI